jgi:hypothetical protein
MGEVQDIWYRIEIHIMKMFMSPLERVVHPYNRGDIPLIECTEVC